MTVRFVSDFKVGDRVQTHPLSQMWKSGHRFGTVVSLEERFVVVVLETKPQSKHGFLPNNISPA